MIDATTGCIGAPFDAVLVLYYLSHRPAFDRLRIALTILNVNVVAALWTSLSRMMRRSVRFVTLAGASATGGSVQLQSLPNH
jgi:hypothetical protein